MLILNVILRVSCCHQTTADEQTDNYNYINRTEAELHWPHVVNGRL